MRANRTMATPSQPIVPKKRCAIYTRKSTDEGLDQEYNSLEAQRDAGLAFVASQRHEGWVAVGDGYDDGGYSGGNLDRPGLKRLMADIEAGKIDIVVVYKIDRLTRALSDFAKLVDVFDRNGVSFVSVTQQFNTTTSMGRLTLNILLSFAQFEREVTGERTGSLFPNPSRMRITVGWHLPAVLPIQVAPGRPWHVRHRMPRRRHMSTWCAPQAIRPWRTPRR